MSTRLNALRAAVMGANDGIVSIAAMLLGMVAAGAESRTVMLAGLAATTAGGGVDRGRGIRVGVGSARHPAHGDRPGAR